MRLDASFKRYAILPILTASMGVVISAGPLLMRSKGVGEGPTRPKMDTRDVGILPSAGRGAAETVRPRTRRRIDVLGTAKSSRLKAFEDHAKRCLMVLVTERCDMVLVGSGYGSVCGSGCRSGYGTVCLSTVESTRVWLCVCVCVCVFAVDRRGTAGGATTCTRSRQGPWQGS